VSFFERIRNAIFQRSQIATPARPATAPGNPAAPKSTGAPTAATAGADTASAPAPRPAPPTPASGAPGGAIDIEPILDGLSARNPQQLNWRTSIVDLLKLLDLDSSLQHRKELAKELGYTASTEDSAAMNVWLHRQVMKKLAENGGKVPATLQ
jgi:hypothetical protein